MNTPSLGHCAQNPAIATETRIVTIPTQPDGLLSTVKLLWRCPVCGEPRGDVFTTKSYEGRRPIDCDGWKNPCGHLDQYDDVIQEAERNGLNETAKNPADDAPQSANGESTRPSFEQARDAAQTCLLSLWKKYHLFINGEPQAADITPVDCSIVIEEADKLIAALRHIKTLAMEGKA